MEPTRKIVRIDAHIEAPGFPSALVRAFLLGSSFVGVYDENDYLRYANDSFLRMFALEAGQVATFADIVLDAARNGKTVRIEAEDPIAFIADAQTRRRGCFGESRQRSFPVDFVDDHWFWCTETFLPDGWIVLTGADITSLKQTERILSAQRDEAVLLSGIDELTGVPNRRLTLARLDALLHTPDEGHSPVTVALLDLDHFKSINDTFGHETGDEALRHFSQHCTGLSAGRSVLGRLGGEEFLIILPRLTVEQAKQELEAMMRSIPPVCSRLPAHVTITLSFSAGVAQSQPGESRSELLRRADAALYLAKTRGRRRVEIHRSDVPSMEGKA
ncbi:hypothetical protein CR51_11685 [Caballeronia megalochromosomata]|nr:hypothetical protein CR51_11685 [Caballeronia megalochromosomata]